jgi:hypothetical protein
VLGFPGGVQGGFKQEGSRWGAGGAGVVDHGGGHAPRVSGEEDDNGGVYRFGWWAGETRPIKGSWAGLKLLGCFGQKKK